LLTNEFFKIYGYLLTARFTKAQQTSYDTVALTTDNLRTQRNLTDELSERLMISPGQDSGTSKTPAT